MAAESSSLSRVPSVLDNPAMLAVLPGYLLVQLVSYLNKFKINLLCRSNKTLAYRLCGTRTKGTDPTLTDADVVPELWQLWLRREYGISRNPDECAAETRVYREMTASAFELFIARQTVLAEQDLRPLYVSTNPRTVLLKIYSWLFKYLSNSHNEPLSLDAFATDAQNVILDCVLYGSMIMLKYDIAGQATSTLIASIVSIIHAVTELELGTNTAEAVFDNLRIGRYGRVLLFNETLLLRTPCVFRAVAAWNRGDSPLSLDFLLPPNRPLAALPQFDLEAAPGALKLSAAVSALIVANINSFESAEGFFNDDGNNVLFCAHTRNPQNQRSILQIAANFDATANAPIGNLYQRIHDVRLDNGCRWATTFFKQQQNYELYTNSQTEKTYLYITNQLDGAAPLRSIGHTSSIVIAKHRQGGLERIVKTFELADLIRLHRLPYSEVDETEYAVDVMVTTFSTDPYTSHARYLIGIYERITVLNGPFNANYFLIKVDLKENGDLDRATLYTIPMPQGVEFREVIETHIVSKNLFALTVQLADGTAATILADFEQNIVYHGQESYFQQTQPITLVFVPTLSASQANEGEEELVLDSIRIRVANLTVDE